VNYRWPFTAAVSHLGAVRTHRIHRAIKGCENNSFLKPPQIQKQTQYYLWSIGSRNGWLTVVKNSITDYSWFQIRKTSPCLKEIIFDDGKISKEGLHLELKDWRKTGEESVFETTIFLGEGKNCQPSHLIVQGSRY